MAQKLLPYRKILRYKIVAIIAKKKKKVQCNLLGKTHNLCLSMGISKQMFTHDYQLPSAMTKRSNSPNGAAQT